MTFDPFDRDAYRRAVAEKRAADEARSARLADLRAGLGHPSALAALRRLLAEEEARPSFRPGEDQQLTTTTWREGRKAVLRDLLAELQPTTLEIAP